MLITLQLTRGHEAAGPAVDTHNSFEFTVRSNRNSSMCTLCHCVIDVC
jgi:hypothetical protein